jgi:polyisoprenoid-binding protein YceI
MKRTVLFVGLVLSAGLAFSQTTWKVDKNHSNIQFNVTHMVVAEVNGSFNDFEGQVVASGDDFNGADVSFVAKTASINTDNERRDNHLKSDDFFNAEKFPELKFEGKLVKEGDKYQLKGKFTIRDVTKDVVFPVKHMGKVNTGRGEKAGFKIEGKINRLDYGLKWDSAIQSGELVVADEVEIVCRIELNKAS